MKFKFKLSGQTKSWHAMRRQKVFWWEPEPANGLLDLTELELELTTHFEQLAELVLLSSESWEVRRWPARFWVKSVWGRWREHRTRRRRRRRRRRRGRLRLSAAISPQLSIIQIVQYHEIIISRYHNIPMLPYHSFKIVSQPSKISKCFHHVRLSGGTQCC